MNIVVLVGRLTRSPELRYTPTGTAKCTFTVAVDDPFGKGEKKVDFIQVVAWQKLAETCAQYLDKGRLVGVQGRWSTRNYENEAGTKIYVNECVADNVRFLERAENGQQAQQGSQQRDPFQDDGKPIDISDDLPF